MKIQYLMLGVFALFGVFLMRGGVTGFVVAENCLEGACPSTGPSLEAPASLSLEESNALSTIGIMMIIISIAMVAGYSNHKKNRLSTEGFD